jgi:hypothetical protein
MDTGGKRFGGIQGRENGEEFEQGATELLWKAAKEMNCELRG